MLVLTRKLGEKIVIGDEVTLTVVAVFGKYVRIGIEAPGHVRILRSELAAWDEDRAQHVRNGAHVEANGR